MLFQNLLLTELKESKLIGTTTSQLRSSVVLLPLVVETFNKTLKGHRLAACSYIISWNLVTLFKGWNRETHRERCAHARLNLSLIWFPKKEKNRLIKSHYCPPIYPFYIYIYILCVRVRECPLQSVFPLIKILELTDFDETWYTYKPFGKASKPYRLNSYNHKEQCGKGTNPWSWKDTSATWVKPLKRSTFWKNMDLSKRRWYFYIIQNNKLAESMHPFL